MSHDHGFTGVLSTLSSWGLVGVSVIAQAIPVLQLLALTLAVVASVYTIKNHRAQIRAREAEKG